MLCNLHKFAFRRYCCQLMATASANREAGAARQLLVGLHAGFILLRGESCHRACCLNAVRW